MQSHKMEHRPPAELPADVREWPEQWLYELALINVGIEKTVGEMVHAGELNPDARDELAGDVQERTESVMRWCWRKGLTLKDVRELFEMQARPVMWPGAQN